MKTKDFLFFNYNWVPNSTFIFESFRKMGHDIDIVGEEELRSFQPDCKYKNVVLYLHEGWSIPITNYIIDNYCQDSFLIQHDDTDFEQLQKWSNRTPDLFMQREYTPDTNIDNVYFGYSPQGMPIERKPVEPFHFPIASMYDENLQEKKWDLCFLGRPTNHRRQIFIDKINELRNGSLSHLNWFVKYEYVQTPELYKEIINGCKIGLNSPGNSYDSWRNWELASVKSCIIQPKLKVKSCDDEHMPFNEYLELKDDYSDLEEKILYALENDRWKEIGQKAFDEYNANHTPEKCFEYYYNTVMKYANK
jgi:hypothetical protein